MFGFGQITWHVEIKPAVIIGLRSVVGQLQLCAHNRLVVYIQNMSAERLRNNQIFLRRILKGTTAGKIAIRKMMQNFVQPMILLR